MPKKTFKRYLRPGFECEHCCRWVPINKRMGTRYRNHCPHCLYSKHLQIPCHGLMLPLGLTFKKEGKDKCGRRRQGEMMLIHQCQKCRGLSLNRLAADDAPASVLKIFNQSLLLEKEVLDSVANEGIVLLTAKDRPEIQTQLFGKVV